MESKITGDTFPFKIYRVIFCVVSILEKENGILSLSKAIKTIPALNVRTHLSRYPIFRREKKNVTPHDRLSLDKKARKI